MDSPINPSPDGIAPRITYVPCGELKIYGVSEHELEAIQRGGPESIFSNCSIACLTTAVSFTVTLATTEIKSGRVFSSILIVTVLGYLAGLVLALLWRNTYRSKKDILSAIRQRLPQPAAQPLPIPGTGDPPQYKLSGSFDMPSVAPSNPPAPPSGQGPAKS